MSGSIHITIKNFKGLTKEQIKEQANDPDSDLKKWAKKSELKKTAKKKERADRLTYRFQISNQHIGIVAH